MDRLPHSEPREVPQLATDFMRSLRRRSAQAQDIEAGGSAADRHLLDTGHELERGCCTLPANRCIGCHSTLPREAKVKHELYCSRACREGHTST